MGRNPGRKVWAYFFQCKKNTTKADLLLELKKVMPKEGHICKKEGKR
jgi:hypothetical protein